MDSSELVLAMSIVLCTLTAILTYYSRAWFLVKLITMPFAVLTSIAAIWTIISLAGAPIDKYPKDEWIYVGHQIIDKGENIVLWIWKDELLDFRLHKFPYTREMQKKLNEAQESMSNGSPQQGEFKNDAKTGDAVLSIKGYDPVNTNNYVKE